MSAGGPLAKLRGFARRQSAPAPGRCELCGSDLAAGHEHLVSANGKIACSCTACALLFPARKGGRFRRVPREVIRLPDDEALEALAVPVGLAFFVRGGPDGRVRAVYPSPAGPTPADVDPEAWRRLEERVPALARMEADVEALLLHRIGGARDAFLAPIDLCYGLAGRLRLAWRGISGGDEVRRELDAFVGDLRMRAGEVGHA